MKMCTSILMTVYSKAFSFPVIAQHRRETVLMLNEHLGGKRHQLHRPNLYSMYMPSGDEPPGSVRSEFADFAC